MNTKKSVLGRTVAEKLRGWCIRLFGWQFLSFPKRAHQNICDTLRQADRMGVKVLGLGALNKAEFMNGFVGEMEKM